MTKAEVKILDDMLEDLDNYYGNAGCNDLTLENTSENREVVKAAQKNEGEEVYIYKDKICATDFVVLNYLRKRLRESV